MKRSRKPVACLIVAALAAALLLAGCEGGAKEQMGTVLGAGLGAVAGSQIGDGRGQLLAIAAGTLIGSLVGSEVGRSLDKADLAYMHHTQQQALETAPSGTSTVWQNPDSGNSGAIVPQPAVQQADGTYCREFQQEITVGGNTETAYGQACRQPDGQWKII